MQHRQVGETMPMEMYQELGRVNTVKDTEVDDQFVSDTQS